jgi:pilus assembly protein CpaE
MADPLRVVLFNLLGTREMSFRAPFEQVPGIKILCETLEWVELKKLLREPGVDLVAIGLDDQHGTALDIVERVSQAAPDCGIIGISRSADPAAIIRAMRAGCSQFVCSPIDVDDLRNAVQRIRSTRQVMSHACERFCVIGSSGGAGATFIACHLALELAHVTDRQTALVDLNLEFGDVNCAFDCTPDFNIVNLCRPGVMIDSVMLSKGLHPVQGNVSILARPENIGDAREVTPEGVQNMFHALAEKFPYVVVDLPRAFDYLNAAAVADAAQILIVTQLSVPSLRNAGRVHRCLRDLGANDDHIGIVLNRCNSGYERITPEDVEEHFRRPPLAMIPNDYRRVQTSLDFGKPMEDGANTPARLAIRKLARTLIGESGEKQSGGLLGKLLGWSSKEKNGQPAATSSI